MKRTKIIMLVCVAISQVFYIWFIVTSKNEEVHLREAKRHFENSSELVRKADASWANTDQMNALLKQSAAEFALGQAEIRSATNK